MVRPADQVFAEELRAAATDKKVVASAVAGIVNIYVIPFKLSEYRVIFTNSKRAGKTGGFLCDNKKSRARANRGSGKRGRRDAVPCLLSVPAPIAGPAEPKSSGSEAPKSVWVHVW